MIRNTILTLVTFFDEDLKNEIPSELFDFKYFFHPVRISILKLLSTNVTLLTTEIKESLGVTWNEFRPHLDSLREKGFIRVSERFIDEALKNIVQMEPHTIRLFEEFSTLLVEFLDTTDKFERYVTEASKIKDGVDKKSSNLYPID